MFAADVNKNVVWYERTAMNNRGRTNRRNQPALWIWLSAGCALLLVLSCGYPAGVALQRATDMLAGNAADAPPEAEGLPPGQVGQRLEQGGIGFTVLSVKTSSDLEGNLPPDPSKLFLLVEVLVENDSGAPLTSPVAAFRLTDGQNAQYTSVSVAGLTLSDPGWQWPEVLADGEQVRGLRAFAVDQTAAVLVLGYEPFEFFERQIPPIQVALGDLAPLAGQPVPAVEPPSSAIGQRHESGGVALTVQSIERLAQFLDQAAGENQEFMVIEVQVENNSGESVMIGNLMFALSDDSGAVFLNSLPDDPQELDTGWLDDGASAEGRLTFTVPVATTDLFLTYNPIGHSAAQPIRIALGKPPEPTTTPGTAAAPAGTAPTPAPEAPIGVVVNGGNLRAGPGVGSNIIAQVCPDDQVEFLAQQQEWYRVRVYATAENCVAQRATVGTEGWLNRLLVSTPSSGVPGDSGAAQPVQPGGAGTGAIAVAQAGNIRSEPSLSEDTILGQVCPGDGVQILELRESEGAVWYRVRVTNLSTDCVPEHVAINTEGWVGRVLLALP